MMSGDLRVLAEKYVALTGEIEDVRRAMLACLTNGGGELPRSLSPGPPGKHRAGAIRRRSKRQKRRKPSSTCCEPSRGSRPANWPSRAERKSRRWPSGCAG